MTARGAAAGVAIAAAVMALAASCHPRPAAVVTAAQLATASATEGK